MSDEVLIMQWYVLRVAPNKEVEVKETLAQKVQTEDLTGIIGRIEVPIDRIKRIRGSKQMVQTKPKYSGYVFMEMESTEDGRVPEKAWFTIKSIPGVTDFVPPGGVPSPMRDTEVAKMLEDAEKPEETPSIKVEFKKGDMIRIREGAFENFEGVVDLIDSERGIVKVIVTIFGRSTPLDIEYWQIEKL